MKTSEDKRNETVQKLLQRSFKAHEVDPGAAIDAKIHRALAQQSTPQSRYQPLRKVVLLAVLFLSLGLLLFTYLKSDSSMVQRVEGVKVPQQSFSQHPTTPKETSSSNHPHRLAETGYLTKEAKTSSRPNTKEGIKTSVLNGQLVTINDLASGLEQQERKQETPLGDLLTEQDRDQKRSSVADQQPLKQGLQTHRFGSKQLVREQSTGLIVGRKGIRKLVNSEQHIGVEPNPTRQPQSEERKGADEPISHLYTQKRVNVPMELTSRSRDPEVLADERNTFQSIEPIPLRLFPQSFSFIRIHSHAGLIQPIPASAVSYPSPQKFEKQHRRKLHSQSATNNTGYTWLVSVVPLTTLQRVVLLPKADSRVQDVIFPNGLTQTSGFKASLGIEKKGVQATLNVSQFHLRSYYQYSTDQYVVDENATNQYTIKRLGVTDTTNFSVQTIGLSLRKQIHFGSPLVGRLFTTIGAEYAHSFAGPTNQFFFVNLTAGKHITLSRQAALSIGPYLDYSFTQLLTANQLRVRPYQVGLSIGLRLGHPAQVK